MGATFSALINTTLEIPTQGCRTKDNFGLTFAGFVSTLYLDRVTKDGGLNEVETALGENETSSKKAVVAYLLADYQFDLCLYIQI